MLNNQLIWELFAKDRNHFALWEYFLNNQAEIIYAEEDGLLAFFGGVHAIYSKDEKSVDKILDLIDNANCFVCSSQYESEAVLKRFTSLKRIKPCYQILYRKPYGVRIPKNTEVKELLPTDENIDFVTNTYTLKFNREDIKRLMTNFTFYATYTNGEISGYIGRHDEGSIGLLEIMPKFRRMGLGAFLVDYSVCQVLNSGDVAFCNIEKENEKSLKMHLKMGFVPSEKFVYWCV